MTPELTPAQLAGWMLDSPHSLSPCAATLQDMAPAPTDDDISHPLAKSSLSLSKQVPVEQLKKMALAPSASASAAYASAAAGEDDVPVQKMSDFLAGGSVSGSSAASSAARAALFAVDDSAEAAEAAKKKSLFSDGDNSEDEDPVTRERKAKKRAAAQAAAAEKAQAQAAAQAAQQARLEQALADSAPTSPSSSHGATAPASAAAASKRAGAKDLFDGTDDSAAQRKLGLKGVFVPKGAAEYHEQAIATEEVDPALLQEADDAELERLGGEAAAGAAPARSSAGGAAPNSAVGASAASAAVSDDLDDDLFSFAAPSATTKSSSAVDPDAADFNINDYLASQAITTNASAAKGASLFDDDD